MPGTHKRARVLVGLALTAAALTGCTAPASEAAQTPEAMAPGGDAHPAAEATPTPEPTEPESCSRMSEISGYTDGLYWERHVPLEDFGAREYAQGEVTFDENGNPATYTVEPGDVEAVIAERLCAYPSIGSFNHVRTIQPGQVLWLTPDPDLPWIPYFSPIDAREGFHQIPYQQAMDVAREAVDARDVEAVRAIWNDTLRGMFENQETIDAVEKVVDSGDPDGLRQLFS